MSKVKVTLPGLEFPVTGKQVSFKAPCDCSNVECIQIDGVDYTVVDALGRQVTGSPKGGTWASGAQVSVILDCENKKAFLQNGNVTPDIIGAAYRPNLLHNWHFAKPINQRGEAEYKEVGYTIDRWYSNSESLTVKPTEEGLLLSAADNSARLSQYIQIPPSAAGKECVLSLLMKDPSSISVTIDNPFSIHASGMSRLAEFSFTPTEGVETIKISIRPQKAYDSSVAEVTLIAAKLEIGSIQTLAHEKGFDALGSLYWELNETPDYHEEFMKCIQSTADSSDDYANKVIYHTGNKPTSADISFAVAKDLYTLAESCTMAYDGTTMNTPYKAGVTSYTSGICHVFVGTSYKTILCVSASGAIFLNTYNGNVWFGWKRLYGEDYKPTAADVGAARVATGSYVGTGTYGEANPVSIEFGFTPKMVTIYREAGGIDGGTWGYGAAVGMMYPCTYYSDVFGASEYRPEMVYLTWGDTSVSWYDSDNARQALNELDATYRWVAIY